MFGYNLGLILLKLTWLYFYFQFLTRALSFAVSSLSTQPLHPVLRREDSDSNISKTEAGASNKDWPAAIYKLAEQFGLDSDSLKRHFVRELYSAGFDELAKEVKQNGNCITNGMILTYIAWFSYVSTFFFFSPDHVLCTRSEHLGFTAPKDCGTASCSRDSGCFWVQWARKSLVSSANTDQQLDQITSNITINKIIIFAFNSLLQK